MAKTCFRSLPPSRRFAREYKLGILADVTPIFDEIRASDLEAWAERFESEQWLPSLMRQLVLASGAKIQSCRFLTHEQTNLGGCDGVVDAETDGLCVPAGVSGWELSKRDDVVNKADEDITKDAGEIKPADSTFVAVTLRAWPKKKQADGTFQDSNEHKAAWEQEKRAAFGWKRVRVLDSSDLATMLAHAPGVSIWLTQIMGQKINGARSLITHWDDLKTLCVGLSPETFLAGRRSFTDALGAWLAGPACAFEAQTYSYEDLRDALAAWWAVRANSDSISPLSPVAVSSIEAWTHLVRTTTPLLLLADEGIEITTEQISAAIARGHYVMHRTSTARTSGLGSALPPLHRDALANELQKIGLDGQAAWRMAGDVAGSGVALKRVLLGHSVEPPWARPSNAASLAPVILLGAWDAKTEGDREKVAAIFGRSYEEVEALLDPWTQSNDPLVRRSESRWRVVVREDAWRWLLPFLKPNHYERFREVAVQVLGELNPRYDLPSEQRLYANIYGAVPRHSHRLRRAIGETLCLLSLRPPQGDKVPDTAAVTRAVVSEVFKNAADWRLWASLDYSLISIAEAAPDMFLKVVEDDMERSLPATVALFGQGGNAFFNENPHVEIMWALEALLLEKQWVTRALVALARLAARDPGGNTHPRPLGVLRQAFLPWLPQCCLDVGDRCLVLDKIMAAEPTIGWKLFMALLPKKHDAISATHRPAYRTPKLSKEQHVSDDGSRQQVEHVARRLVEMAGSDTTRWQELIKEMDVLPQNVFDVLISQIQTLAGTLDEEQRARLWESLRFEVAQSRYFANAKWKMAGSRIAAIEALVKALEPTNPVLGHVWLFAGHRVYLPNTTTETPFEEQERLRDEARVVAIREIFHAGGLASLLDLLGRISEADGGRVGFLAAMHGVVMADSEILPAWLESDSKQAVAFARAYAHARFSAGGWDWLMLLGAAGWKPSTFAELSVIFPFNSATWDKVDSISSAHADAYWQKAPPWTHQATQADIQRSVRELIAHNRALAALECVHNADYHKIPLDVDTVISAINAVKTRLMQLAEQDVQKYCEEAKSIGLAEVFALVQDNASLSPEQADKLQGLEWYFLPLLGDLGSPHLLLQRLSREPAFFIELLQLTVWPDNQPEDQRPTLTEQQKNRAEHARSLLEKLERLPGCDDEGKLDETAFVAWIKESRRLAAERGYRYSCEYRIGEMLLHSPVDPAGYWPCATVCRLLSDDASDEMRQSLETAIFNNQGWPGPLGDERFLSSESGRQNAVDKLHAFAEKIEVEFPIVAGLLRDCAKAQENVLHRHLHDDD